MIINCFNIYLAGKDFENIPLQVTFQPGESHRNICVIIMDDDMREGNEKFHLLLSVPYSVRTLGVWTGYPYNADIIIIGMQYFAPVTYTCMCYDSIYF